jgi:hypothetical protein
MSEDTQQDQPDVLLRLRALPADVPPAARLRRLLKILLRVYRFKCVAVTEVSPGEPDGTKPQRSGGQRPPHLHRRL